MIHRVAEVGKPKGWFVGPWDSDVPVPVGYANEGINEEHYHASMYEIYLIAKGTSTAVVNGRKIRLGAGEVLIVEPGEVHTFVENSEDYLHFVFQTPFVAGDKVLTE